MEKSQEVQFTNEIYKVCGTFCNYAYIKDKLELYFHIMVVHHLQTD